MESSWASVSRLLETLQESGAFPGAVALVGNATHTLYSKAFGNLTDDGRPPPLPFTPLSPTTTLFDLASLTKVIATTSAVMLLYQDGLIKLEETAAAYIDDFGGGGKGNITLLQLLTHSAGFPPDPSPDYWDPAFGCAGAPVPPDSPSPLAAAASCTERAFASLCAQKLASAPGEKYVYSDLSFISLMYIVGAIAASSVGGARDTASCSSTGSRATFYQCQYEAFVRTRVFEKLGMAETLFNPSTSMRRRCAPTTVPLIEGTGRFVLQGRVSDGNAMAVGGVSGHAGIFSSAPDLARYARAFLTPTTIFRPATVERFTMIVNASLSSRALGWNTNNPQVPDRGWDLSCGVRWPASTFTHVGYAGTQLCIDRESGVYSILLTNRVYPSDAHSRMHTVRQSFGDAVHRVLERDQLTRGDVGPRVSLQVQADRR